MLSVNYSRRQVPATQSITNIIFNVVVAKTETFLSMHANMAVKICFVIVTILVCLAWDHWKVDEKVKVSVLCVIP